MGYKKGTILVPKPNCLDCEIKLKDYRSSRCKRCANLGQLNPHFGKKRTLEARIKTSQANKGNVRRKGFKWPIEHRLKLSKIQKQRVLEGKNNFYIDGRDKLNHTERYSKMKTPEYKFWRESIFEKDNYTCQECNQHGGYLEADHIKPWALYPELRFELSNGRTLCRNCHQKTDTWGGRSMIYA